MAFESRTVRPSMAVGCVRDEDGNLLEVPAGWALLPPGDATLTRRVKAAGPSWTVESRKDRKVFSRGVWAPADVIADQRAKREAELASHAHQRRLERDRQRRAEKEVLYQQSFAEAVFAFLNFAPAYESLAHRVSAAVAAHACPVGSGTVARTKRIDLEDRAERALIAWMRHNTSDYDRRRIARVRGARRSVRREIAQQSRTLLHTYRQGLPTPPTCPLLTALGE